MSLCSTTLNLAGRMIWQIDSATRIAAQRFPIPIYTAVPLAQDPGNHFNPVIRQHRLRPGDVFPPPPLTCSPAQIISELQAGHYLQALALTVVWGRMERTANLYIYRQHTLQHIHNTLDQCASSIRQTNSIQQSWNLLTQNLLWTNVIISKTLHFLCRALGFTQDPPVPIDGAVILDYVWPGFRMGIPPLQRPQDWSGNEFAAYSRYMTAILEWAKQKQWTTTQVESTIYAENY
jgi:hypothetical protein